MFMSNEINDGSMKHVHLYGLAKAYTMHINIGKMYKLNNNQTDFVWVFAVYNLFHSKWQRHT